LFLSWFPRAVAEELSACPHSLSTILVRAAN